MRSVVVGLVLFASIACSSAANADDCAGTDWATDAVPAFTAALHAELARWIAAAPILVEARVTASTATAEPTLSLRVERVYRGAAAGAITLTIAHPTKSTPRPQKGELWILALASIGGGVATPRGVGCGALGFPASRTSVVRELERIVDASTDCATTLSPAERAHPDQVAPEPTPPAAECRFVREVRCVAPFPVRRAWQLPPFTECPRTIDRWSRDVVGDKPRFSRTETRAHRLTTTEPCAPTPDGGECCYVQYSANICR